MQIKFKAFGPLRKFVSEKEVTLEIPDSSTVQTVIELIVNRWGSDVETLIINDGQISGNLILMLNMKDISTLDGLRTAVNPDDELIILPHVQGG